MARRRRPIKREVLADPVFGDVLVTKFINCMMEDGKKSAAEKIFYGAIEIVTQKAQGEEAIAVFKRALENLKPQVEVRTRRVGGSNYQVPVEVRPERRVALAMRWIVTYARERGEKTMRERLAALFELPVEAVFSLNPFAPLSAEALLDACLARIARFNPALNALVTGCNQKSDRKSVV